MQKSATTQKFSKVPVLNRKVQEMKKLKDEAQAFFKEVNIGKVSEAKQNMLAKEIARITEDAGGYPSGVGGTFTDATRGSFLGTPELYGKLVTRWISENEVLRDLIDVQAMTTNYGQVFGMRMMNGKFGEAGIDNVTNEFERPLNNRVPAGRLTFLFDGSEAGGTITLDEIRIVDGSYKEDIEVNIGGDVFAIPSQYLGTTTITVGGLDYTLAFDYEALVDFIINDIDTDGQFSSALRDDTKAMFEAGIFNTAVNGEFVIRGLAISGLGIRNDYGLGLGDYATDVDPTRTGRDLATATFIGDTATTGGADSKFQNVTPRFEFAKLEATENSLYAEIPRLLEQDVDASLGINVENIIQAQCERLLSSSTSQDVLSTMKQLACNTALGGASVQTFDFDGDEVQGRWLQEKASAMLIALSVKSHEVLRANGYLGRGDFAVVSPTVSALLFGAGSLFNKYDIDDSFQKKSAYMGKIGFLDMYSDIWGEFVDLNTGSSTGSLSPVMVGMKATGEVGESGVIMGTYKPIELEAVVKDPNTMNKKMLVRTRYALTNNVLDSGAFYRGMMVDNLDTAIFG